jgi:hypothetical protein
MPTILHVFMGYLDRDRNWEVAYSFGIALGNGHRALRRGSSFGEYQYKLVLHKCICLCLVMIFCVSLYASLVTSPSNLT